MKKVKKLLASVMVMMVGVTVIGCQSKDASGEATENWPTEAVTIICPWAVG